MRLILLATVMVAAGVTFVPPASADPAPSPGPYQIITPSGPQIGGLRTLPPICAVQPRACNLNWNPNTGAWDAPTGTGSP